jgi:hypothetical protein
MNSTKPPSLLTRSDIAAEVGFLIMFAGNLEGWLLAVLAELLGDEAAAVAIVRNVDNLSAKWAIVFSIAADRPKDRLAQRILENEDAIRGALAHRNLLAHGLYVWDDADQLCLVKGAATARHGKARGEPFDIQATRMHTENLRVAIVDILGQLGELMTIATDDPSIPRPSGSPKAKVTLEKVRANNAS